MLDRWKEIAAKHKELVNFIFAKSIHPLGVERKKYNLAIQKIIDRKGLLTIESIEAEASLLNKPPVFTGIKS